MSSVDAVNLPSDDDRGWLVRAEEHALTLLRDAYGDVSFTRAESDLGLFQQAIDDGIVAANQELELRCLSVILGNVFVEQTEMDWAIVTNAFGALLAIHAPRLGFTRYPITMISKRAAEGREVDVPALYRSVVSDLGL